MSKNNLENKPVSPELIVGLGASAGGLDSFKAFFSKMPEKPGMAFVLLPHLNPNHPSLMPELLASQTRLPVFEVQDNMPVEADHVYILPAAKRVTFAEGRLHLEAAGETREKWSAIETFLMSLALEQKQRAVAIIMSGTGNHGAQGLREIKLNGGLILAQQPKTCQYPQMPINAIESGLVDRVLAPQDMPKALLDYANHPYLINTEKSLSEIQLMEMQQILSLLRKRIKHDFSCYRKNMLLRRIQRRMSVCHCQTLTEYAQHLTDNTAETMLLCKDLLIGVTAFFRDPEAFHVLQHRVIPELVAACNEDEPVRIWVPACASGEEAYSLAILVYEEFERVQKAPRLQIFASDIDEESLKVARQGIYPEALMLDISPDRLHRYFYKVQGNKYSVKKQLRESIVFASQNLISDAPFSRLDLITCRNFLIYLQTELQAKVLNLFHFALKAGGYLMLGPSESLGRKAELFSTVSKKWRVFKHLQQAGTVSLDMPVRSNLTPHTLTESTNLSPIKSTAIENRYNELVQRDLLKIYAPAAVLINANYQVLHFQGPTVDFLEFPAGLPSTDLTHLVREGLRTRIRALVHNASKKNQMMTDRNARVKRQGHYYACTLCVRPVLDHRSADKLFLVTFQDNTVFQENNVFQGNSASYPVTAIEVDSMDESSVIKQLEDELNATREDLQSGIEELKASNEEVMSMNEELQSANEELETSKEELQSSNEELTTVNTELQCKLEELEKSNDDISNLLSSTDIATVFLNREMKIMLFNPATAKLLNLRPSDIDRPISDFSSKLSNHHFLQDAQAVLDFLTPVERDVSSRVDDSGADISSRVEGPCYLRRIVPYRTADERIVGVVVTFVEITERFHQEKALEQRIQQRTQELYERENRLQAIMDHASEAIIVINVKGLVTDFNRAAEQMFGYSAKEIVGNNINRLMPAHHAERHDDYLANFQRTGESKLMLQPRSLNGLHKNGSEFPIELTVNQVDQLEIYVGIIRDLSEKRALQKAVADINSLSQEKIGIELHDCLGQRLTGINLLLENFKQNFAKTQPTKNELLEEISLQLSQAIGETREISHGLAPISLTPQGLQDALQELTNINDHRNINIQFQSSLTKNVSDRTVAVELFRIAQEALNNALKYANATNILVTLDEHQDTIQLSIIDDGIGFDLQHPPSDSGIGIGIGIQIMRYRAESIGGLLKIDSSPGKGTRVTCTY